MNDTWRLTMLVILWKIFYWAWIVTEVLVLTITRTRAGDGVISDRGSLRVLWITVFSSIWLGSWYAAAQTFGRFNPGHWVRPAGLALLIVGLMVRWTAIASLGRAFSANVAVRDEQTVYKRGLFRFVRHPSYLGMEIIFLALGLETHNWVAMAILLLPSTAALVYRMHVEEAALLRAFGVEYADYSRSTSRLLPGIY